MNNNIVEKYVDFSLKSLSKYCKLIFKTKLKLKEIQIILDTYKEVRYYNYLELTQNGIKNNMLKEYKKFVSTLDIFKNYNEEKKQYLAILFQNIFCFDNFLEEKEIDFILMNILKLYYKIFEKDLENLKEIKDLVKDVKKKRINYLKSFKTDKFYIEYEKFNSKLYGTSLKYTFDFPKIYSDFAIQRVYQSEIIHEQKMFVLYNLVTLKILNEIINYDFKNKYLVSYPISLLSKEDKKKRFLNLINSDAIKDKLILEFDYSSYLDLKDFMEELLQDGYHIMLSFSEKIEFDEILIKKLSIFDGIIVKNKNLFDYYRSLSQLVLVKE